jgi:hypothetical protein
MKRFLAILITAAALMSLCACSLLPIDTDPYGTDMPPTPSASAVKTPAATSPAPSPTTSPSPTLSPTAVSPSPSQSITPVPSKAASQQTQGKYEKLIGYCRDYGDISAAVEIKDMYSGGEITKEQFSALFDIFGDMESYGSSDWAQAEDEVRSLGDIINGRKSNLEEDEGEYFYETMCVLPQHGAAYINLFDSQQKQDRVKAAIDLIKKWYADPTDENLKSFEEAYYSQDLTPGEIFMIGYYMYYGEGMPARIQANVSTIDFISQQGYIDYADAAYYELIDINKGN